jgi:NAD(P)-dependent dehydrogenase (short-subunit alcohol dehydrogenase family)
LEGLTLLFPTRYSTPSIPLPTYLLPLRILIPHPLASHRSPLTPIQGWTRFSPIADLSATLPSDWDTCFAVNVKAQNYLLRSALPTFTANAEGGSLIMTSSVAGIGVAGSSLPYCVTKAAQIQMMRCLAATQGPKVRVNAVLPGLLLTEWGNKYPKEIIKALEDRAYLKKVVS